MDADKALEHGSLIPMPFHLLSSFSSPPVIVSFPGSCVPPTHEPGSEATTVSNLKNWKVGRPGNEAKTGIPTLHHHT